jgi:putative DNA primase/helicase
VLGLAIVGKMTEHGKDTPLFVGAKDTGKSALLDVFAACFPVASHRCVTLHAMGAEYHRAHLSGGRINFVNELPSRDLLNGEEAKAILSGQKVNCRRPCEVPFEWLPRCAHIFAANELPSSRDAALMGRFVILDCPNVVPRESQDRTLTAKILAEAPHIVAAALGALQVVLERGHLIRPSSSHEKADEWSLQSDPVLAWSREYLSKPEEKDALTPGDELYQAFCDWAIPNGFAKMASTSFGRRLGALNYTFVRRNGTKWYAKLLSEPQRTANREWNNPDRYGSDK